VDIQNIIHCEADRNYTIIYTQGGEHYIFSRTLKEIEKLLPERDFFRTHQSHLINLRHVKKYIRGPGGEIIMSNEKHIKVAKAKKDALMERIFKR
jgi:two-component system LytT family response regulator